MSINLAPVDLVSLACSLLAAERGRRKAISVSGLDSLHAAGSFEEERVMTLYLQKQEGLVKDSFGGSDNRE